MRVETPGLLAGLVSVQAQLDVPGLVNPISQQPRTACEVVGTGFYAVAASAETSRGMLRLGAEDVYRVLDLDPDASALKLEQYVRNVPRMVAVEANGDSVNSAPASLRATGFAVARVDRAQQLHDRLDDASTRDAAVLAGTAPPLRAEDVTRGVRLEVWDDVSGDWHSLHQRRLDVEVEGAGAVLTDEPDTGFLQGASLTKADGVPGAPVNAHEVLAGWDGWSLSTPRPGKVVVHDGGVERVVDAPDVDPDPVNPVASTTRVEPGSLPRLRYGRRYAFRAWTVDLAGNSSPHFVGTPAPTPPPAPPFPMPPEGPLVDAAHALSADRLARLARDAAIPLGPSGGAEDDGRALVAAVRGRLRDLRPAPPAALPTGSGPRGTVVDPAETITGEPALDRLVLSRRAALADRTSARGLGRLEALQRAFVDAAITEDRLLRPTESDTPAEVDAGALLSALATAGRIPTLDLLLALSDQVTTPRPFLRWDPVLEPTVVPRHPYSEAESLLTLAVRSGVDLAATPGGQPTVVPPAVYVPQTLAANPTLDLQWRVESERHIAPPKSSQLECEMHGRFDDAFGIGSALDVRRMLAVALREAGTFLDETVADLEVPGQRNPVQDISFHTTPTAEVPAVTLPGDLPRGEPLTPGQYVVHSGETVEVPYLPDPLATGISLVFPDAGGVHELTGLLAVEGVTLDYEGEWPTPNPYRLVLAAGDELGARVEGHVLTVTIPPGEQLRMRLSSTIARTRLDDLGIWRSLPDVLRDAPLVREAAVDGWFWWLTPASTVRLVHAVPRPVEAPRPTLLLPVRTPGDTAVALAGGVDLHGPSTERLDIEAAWTEQVDDVAKPAPEEVSVVAAACHTSVAADEDLLVLLGTKDGSIPLPDGGTLRSHAAVHQLGDTRHRMITYTMRATTRYREFFDPRVLPTADDVSIVGPARVLDVPSTARPPKPRVVDALPLFRWSQETESDQPFALRRTRRCGVRLYLQRPWFGSGDGELLGVVLASGSDAVSVGSVSEWAADPVFAQQGPAVRSQLPLLDLLHIVGLDDRVEPGRPVARATHTLEDVPGTPSVAVAGYRPEFSAERGLWFVDVALDPGTAFWPFVRFALTRYQPSSLPGKHLSPVVRSDFVQLAPPRTATLSRTDDLHARVVVTGPIGLPRTGRVLREASRRGAERRPDAPHACPAGTPGARCRNGSRLDDRRSARPAGARRRRRDGVVGGFAELPEAAPPRLPGENPDWRVTLEEWEFLPADPAPDGGARREARIVYADHLPL